MLKSCSRLIPQEQEDYDYDATDELLPDYSYYFEGGEDYSDYEEDGKGGAGRPPSAPPGALKPIVFKAGRRSLVVE